MNNEEVLSKVQKLLRVSDSKKNKFLPEAESALAMAHKLLKKYHLSMSEVLALEQEVEARESSIDLGEQLGACFKAPAVPKWMALLVSAVNQVTQTKTLVRYGKPDPGKAYGDLKIVFIGDTTDAKVASELFNYLRNSVTRLSTSHVNEGKGKFQQWRSFAEGCSTQLLQRALHLEHEKNWDLNKYRQKNSSSTLDIDNFILDDDDEYEELDDLEELEDLEDDEKSEESEKEPKESEITDKQKECYALYIVTKQKRIEDYIENDEIVKEEVKNSLKLDTGSFHKGKIAGEDLPLKMYKQVQKGNGKGSKR